MKSLSDLQSVLGGLQGQISGLQQHIDECVDYITQLTGTRPPKRGPYRKAKANGATLRDKVKQHFVANRGGKWARLNALEFVEPSNNTVTVDQAAKMLRMSDANVRLKIKAGDLRAMKELRRGKARTGPGSAPHPVMVINRNEVLAYAEARNGGDRNLVVRHVQPRATTTKKRRPKKRPSAQPQIKYYGSAIVRQRQATAVFLSQFDLAEPKAITDHRIGSLVRRGYLIRHGDNGYVRSGKEFVVQPSKRKDGDASPAPTKKRSTSARPSNKDQRARTAELLATLDREEPRQVEQANRVGVLIQHGYIKAKGEGFVRTAKPFTA